jgi:uncharacterized protein YlxP (DUF503 family)
MCGPSGPSCQRLAVPVRPVVTTAAAEDVSTHITLPVNTVSEEFDMKPAVMDTLFAYLELSPSHFIDVLPPLPATLSVRFYKTSAEALAEKQPVLKAVLEHVRRPGTFPHTHLRHH